MTHLSSLPTTHVYMVEARKDDDTVGYTRPTSYTQLQSTFPCDDICVCVAMETRHKRFKHNRHQHLFLYRRLPVVAESRAWRHQSMSGAMIGLGLSSCIDWVSHEDQSMK